jgi:hypothetical protein
MNRVSHGSLAVVAFIHNRAFGTDVPFIRAKSTVGARSAQVFIARDNA